MLGQIVRRQLLRPVLASARLKCSCPAVVISSHFQTILLKQFLQSQTSRLIATSSIRNNREKDTSKIIDQTISENTVVIFSKTFCPFCVKIKELFASKGIPYKSVELDLMGKDGAEIQSALLEKTGQSTVPSVWIKQKFIGKI
jgi:glutaredoxin